MGIYLFVFAELIYKSEFGIYGIYGDLWGFMGIYGDLPFCVSRTDFVGDFGIYGIYGIYHFGFAEQITLGILGFL